MADRIHLQHLQLRRLPFFHGVAGILDVGDAELRHRDEALDVVPQVDDHALVHQPQHAAAQFGAHRVGLADPEPRILLRLLQAQRDPLVLGVDVQDQHLPLVHLEHHRLDRLADRHDLRRVPHVARPAHLGDVDQSLDPGLQLDERAVIRDRDHLPLHPRADRILRRHVLPGVGLQLLQPEADALALPVDVEDLHFDLLPDVHHFGGVGHAAVAHVGDVQQAVHAAQVDKCTEVGDVLHHALPRLPDLQLLHQDVALRLALRLEQHAARHHDVPPPLIQLDDLELERLPQELVDVGYAPQRDLAPGEERVHAHQVHDHAALDLLDQRPRHRLVLLIGLADPLPHPHEIGLLLREDHRAFLVLQVLEEDLDLVPLLEGVRILELVDRHGAFRLEPDVQDDGGVGHAQHLRFHDLALLDVGERPLVQLRHLRDFVGGILFLEIGPDAEVGVTSGGRRVGRFGQVFRIYQHSVHRFG